MISVENLEKSYKISGKQRKAENLEGSYLPALKGISFTCQPGRVFSLIGPNGAGKTTTLRIVATILKPTAGQITLAGYDVVKDPREIKRRLGFLTGSTGLYERLTPNELVAYFARLNDLDRAKFKQQKETLFSLLDIHPFANKRIGKLSTGMRQKVSIARTMIHDPDVVVFDEPTAGLDVITAANIIDLIKDCKSKGKTVIFSTHIMGEVELLSDDLAIIHEGSLKFNGTYGDFRRQMQSESMVEEFIRIIKAA